MSTLANSTPRSVRGLLVAGIAAGALFALSLAPAPAQAQQTSAEFATKYNAGAQAYKAKDYAKALASAKEAHAVAKSGFEKTASLKLLVAASGASGKYAEEAEALEQLVASEGVGAQEKTTLHKTLAGVYGQINKMDKAIGEFKEYMRGAGGGSAADWDVLSQYYFGARDCRNAMDALDKALAGGKSASENQLKQKDSCYFQAKDNEKVLAVAQELLRRFPKKDWYSQILAIYQEKKIDEFAIFELLRYGYDHDYLDAESDFMKLADKSLDVGATAEAQRVLEKGFAKKIIKNKDKGDRLLKQATDSAAQDAKTIGQADAEARAGKNGDSDVKVGVRFYGMGQFDKAVEALGRGLGADRVARVKRPDDANMVLGIAYLKLKKKAEAEKAFNAAKADPRMAPAASVWLGSI